MRHPLVSLTGTTLRFDRSGRRLFDLGPDGITVRDVASGQTTRLPFAGARAIAGFDDQLWIATHDDQLVRVDRDGRSLGAPIALPFAERAVLVAAPCGSPAAVWSTASQVVFADAGAELPRTTLPVDVAIPLTGTRFVLARGPRVTLLSGASVELAPSSTVLGGCITPDGKVLVLVVARTSGRHLVVVSMTTAQIVWQRAIGHTETVAVGQAAVVIQTGPRVLRVIDLKANRELSTMTLADDVDSLAIDPAGRTVATRGSGGELALHPIETAIGRPTAKPDVAAISAPTTIQPVERSARPATAEPTPSPSPSRLRFSSDGRVAIQRRTPHLDLALVTGDAELSGDPPIAPVAPIAPPATRDHDVPTENVALIPRLGAATTLDWIVGGAEHQEGYY